MKPLETDVLAKLIRSKRECLVQLHDMGQRQLELIEQGEITSLLDVLATKQRTLSRLLQIERALDPFRSQEPQQRPWRAPEDRRQCAEQLRECDALVSEILRQEKRGERALIRRRDDTATRLEGAHLADVARGAYTAQPQHTVNQLDLQSEK